MRMFFRRAIVLSVLVSVATADSSFAQEPEIYRRTEDNRAPLPSPPPRNNLAKCLADPDDKLSCRLAETEATDGGFENYIQGIVSSSSYVNCRQRGGVCLEIATYNPNDDPKPRRKRESKRLKSVDFSIKFDFNTAAVRTSEIRVVAQLAEAMNHAENTGARFAIIGHSDAKGSERYNCNLSKLRALSVASFLIAGGVSKSRLRTVAAGEFLLIDKANGASAANRRVGFARISAAQVSIVNQISALCGVN